MCSLEYAMDFFVIFEDAVPFSSYYNSELVNEVPGMRGNSGSSITFHEDALGFDVTVYSSENDFWFSLEHIAILFKEEKSTIINLIKDVFAEGAVDEEIAVSDFAITDLDGKSYYEILYNL